MVDRQIHFSRNFYQDKKTGYWISTDYPRIRAHRWVWISIHGPIPDGYHIHHKNQNKSDNSIENLELMEKSRHCSIHMMTEENRARFRRIANEYRPLTKKWHRSKEGREWHRKHSLLIWEKRKPKQYRCKQCKEKFESLKLCNTKFCSNNCKSKFRRRSGVDNVEIKCQCCKTKIVCNKYRKRYFCRQHASVKKRRDILQ